MDLQQLITEIHNELQGTTNLHLYSTLRHTLRTSKNLQFLIKTAHNEPLSTIVFAQILEQINTPKTITWAERALLVWLLGKVNLNLEQKQTALRALNEIIATPSKKQTRKLGYSFWITLCFILIILTYLICESITRLPYFYTLVGIVLIIGLFRFHRQYKEDLTRQFAVKTVEKWNDVKSIYALAAGCCDSNSNLVHVAIPALKKAFSGLTEEHYGQLHADTVPNLCKMLKVIMSKIKKAEILDVLAKIGDGRAIPTVQTLAKQKNAIGVKAKAILPILQERQNKILDRNTLLRSSQAPITNPQELLRPTTSNPETEPKQLLRPINRK